MLEWKAIDGGNRVEITTAFGKTLLAREKWIDYYRKNLISRPKITLKDKEIVLTTAKEERGIMTKTIEL